MEQPRTKEALGELMDCLEKCLRAAHRCTPIECTWTTYRVYKRLRDNNIHCLEQLAMLDNVDLIRTLDMGGRMQREVADLVRQYREGEVSPCTTGAGGIERGAE